MCRAANATSAKHQTKPAHSIENEVDCIYIGTIVGAEQNTIDLTEDRAWYTKAIIKGVAVKFKLNTGVEANVLPLSIIQKMSNSVQIKPLFTMLVEFGGSRLIPKGMVSLKCRTTRATATLGFYMSGQSDVPNLGRAACEDLKLVKWLLSPLPPRKT